MFSSKSFMALALTFRTLINFELIFTVWSKVQLHFCMWQFSWFSTVCWRDYSFIFGWYCYLLEIQLVICLWIFWIFNFISLIYIFILVISTTLSLLALLCSKLWNQAVYLVFKIFLTITNMGSFIIPYEF